MKISAILLCFNQEKYIREALSSLLQQEIPQDVELDIVVSDDYSTDHSWEIINKEIETYRKNGGTLPVTLNQNKTNLGCCGNLYQAVLLSKGEYILKFDGDDISVKERISIFKQTYDKHPDALQYGFRVMYMAEDGTVDPCQEEKRHLPEVLSVQQYNNKTPTERWSLSLGGTSAYLRKLFDEFQDFSDIRTNDDTILSIHARFLRGKVVDSSRPVVYYRSTPISAVNNSQISTQERMRKSSKPMIICFSYASFEVGKMFKEGKFDFAETSLLLRGLHAWQIHYTLYPFLNEIHDFQTKWQWFRAWCVIAHSKWFIGLKAFIPYKMLIFFRKQWPFSQVIKKLKS